ncbi:MAG: DUF5703 domain-containing protein [Planctomycetes bacterium]|nr:DUF5703 domain-containing protein [Planctomycetota bacterium]
MLLRWFVALTVMTCLGSLAACRATPRGVPDELARYEPVFTSPGGDPSGAMPLGNGEVGVSAWVEANGDLCFYLARTDAWSEANRLLKLGKVRVRLEPNTLAANAPFRQTLKLSEGVLEIEGGVPHALTELRVFVDSERPVVRVLGESQRPVSVQVTLEPWRTAKKVLVGDELASSWTMRDAPKSLEVWESPDVLLDATAAPHELVWYHRNEHSIVPLTLAHQGLESVSDAARDPLIRRTFGAAVRASGFEKRSSTELASHEPLRAFEVAITTHSAQTESVAEWRHALGLLADGAPSADVARAETAEWWRAFWSRSWVFVEGDTASGAPANAHPLRIGADSNGQNLFHGALGRASVFSRALRAAEIAALAATRPDARAPEMADRVASWRLGELTNGSVSNDAAAGVGAGLVARPQGAVATSELDGVRCATLSGGALAVDDDDAFDFGSFTLEAWLELSATQPVGRIFDKLTAGRSDGFLFDTHPGKSLRLIVGEKILTVEHALERPGWHHVAASYDAASYELVLWLDGRALKSTEARRDPSPPSRITQGYVLQRWIQACAGRGNFPIKFNGSIFTVDPQYTGGPDFDPDWRKWGGDYWWQNTRLPYHPMLASGDFDMQEPLFRFYRDVLPLCAARAKLYHGVRGAYFPETITSFGTYANGDYGWDRTGHAANEVLCPWWQWAWNQGPELVALMLDHYDYTGDERFAREELVPLARAVLDYFDSRFARDERGKLSITPTQALETHWHGVVNDAPTVAGLLDVTERLLELPESVADANERSFWRRMRDATPELPVAERDGVRVLAAAERFDPSRQNVETPELYGVFPFRLVGLGTPLLEEARAAFERRADKSDVGWTQDGHFAALLGLNEEAARSLAAKARNSNPAHRFPAMWGPNFDWLPDQDHGSNLLGLTQLMLLQCNGDTIRLLPAWPKHWNVSFRLHAPRNTVVEATWRDGKLERWVVDPPERRRDVILPQ